MFLQAMMFLVGFMLGLLCAFLLAWIVITKRDRFFKTLQSGIESEKKQLGESLSESQAHISALNERLGFFSDLKEEVQAKALALDRAKAENGELSAKLASLTAENHKTVEFFNQRLSDLSAVHDTMKEAFSSISQEALFKNADLINSSFKQSLDHFFKSTEKDRLLTNESLASVMHPLKDSLVLMEKKVADLESKRTSAYVGLKEQIDALLSSQGLLQKETQHLAQSLNAPTIRGRWGEMQLKRVVELSGMSPHCDFVEQKSLCDGDDVLRPDMIVTLPRNKKIVIDAKAPFEILGQGSDQSSTAQREELRGQELAASLRRHLLSLKKKSYHSFVGESPEFVVMFLPGEAFLHWALLADPNLLEYAAQHDVIIATPVTLVALLKAIAFGFKQEAVANNIEDVRHLAQQLIDRIHKVSVHFEKLGKSLRQATEAYNQTLSSLDSRVLVTARKLSEIKSLASKTDMVDKALPYIDTKPREVMLADQIEGENC